MNAALQPALFGEEMDIGSMLSPEQRALEKSLMVNFKPPGPVAASWLRCTAPMHFIIGPWGSAKTTTGRIKGIRVARLQNPSTRDGIRKARITLVRPNYRRLWKTTVPSHLTVFPKELGLWEGTTDGPAKQTFRLQDRKLAAWDVKHGFTKNPGLLHIEYEFAAIGDLDLESFCLGYQTTAWDLNEANEMPPDCLGMLAGRTGRAFLDEQMSVDEREARGLAEPWTGIYGDLNAPDEDSWFFEDVMQNPPEGCVVFKQPSGFDPAAENLEVLRRIHKDYYRNRAKNMKPWQVRRFIENKTGFSRSGEPVYVNYGEIHAPEVRLIAETGSRLTIGVDQGLTPAAVICQETRDGQFLALRELYTPPGEVEAASTFGERVGRVLLTDYRAWCGQGGFLFSLDPAANARGSDLQRWYQKFQEGVLRVLEHAPYRLAPTNAEQIRIDAVDRWLQAVSRGTAAFRVDPECRWLKRGFAGGYKIARKAGKPGEFHDTVADTPYTHVHDALQYAALLHRPEVAFRGAGSNRNNPAAAVERVRRPVLGQGQPVLG